MKPIRTLFLAPAAALAVIAGCTTDAPAPMGRMGMDGAGPGMGADTAQMCPMYRDLTAGKSPAEQRAAIEAQMQAMHGGSLTPEQLRLRRETMERHCAGAPVAR